MSYASPRSQDYTDTYEPDAVFQIYIIIKQNSIILQTYNTT